jgi:CHAD domain-containing protein
VVTAKNVQMNAAALSIRLLALLEKIGNRAGTEDVHRLRTTVRRLEVHLPDCPPKLSKYLKSLRKKAGKVRDIDVHLDLLKTVLPRPTSTPRTALSATREKLRQKLSKILREQRDSHLESLRETVADATPFLEAKLPIQAERASQREADAQNVHKETQRARKRFLQWTRSVPEDPERLHRLRINTKSLRYSMEMLEENEEAAELVVKFKVVQDAIGKWHDWATLTELAERELESPEAEPLFTVLRSGTGREYRKARRTAEHVRAWMIGKSVASAAADSGSQLLTGKVE